MSEDELGGTKWKAFLEEHEATVRREVARFRGTLVETRRPVTVRSRRSMGRRVV